MADGTLPLGTIICGDCLEELRRLPSRAVQMCVTSPPYWGLRDYNLPPTIYGGSPNCEHSWQQGPSAPTKNATQGGTETEKWPAIVGTWKGKAGQFCTKCGAWKGALGLEPLHDCAGWATGNRCGACYVCHLVEIFAEVRRVLRDDGVLFLNLGDSYAAGGGPGRQALDKFGQRHGSGGGKKHSSEDCGRAPISKGLKPKDLCGIPWRVALALQADGWWLRSDIIWAKTNPMPESVRDRCTKSHEYVFMLAKSKRYYFDQDAIRELHSSIGQVKKQPRQQISQKWTDNPQTRHGNLSTLRSHNDPSLYHPAGRNKRSVWTIATKPFKEAHFAVFPETLIRPMILAGASARGACPECGAAWRRVVERDADYPDLSGGFGVKGSKWKEQDSQSSGYRIQRNMNAMRAMGRDHDNPFPTRRTVGWRPTCDCDAGDPVPCIVLDPFSGAGTTAVVAKKLGRHYIGIELNGEYVEMSERRLAKVTGVQLRLLE